MTEIIDELLGHVEDCQDEIIRLVQDLVRIPTVNTGMMPTGNETKLCGFLQAMLGEEGIESDILESAPNRGNLIARLPGAEGSPKLLFMSHTDVVPVEEEDAWTCPPFGGCLREGRVYGRGSADNKGLVASQAMALIILKRAGVELNGELVFAATADEEAGGRYGFGWLVTTHPDEVKADFAVNEGGAPPIRTKHRLAYLLNSGEKGRFEAKLTVEGRGWHAAQPWRANNPLYRMAEAIRRLKSYEPERNVSLPVFEYLNDLFDIGEKVTSKSIDGIADLVEKTNPAFGAVLRSLSRMTLTPTVVSAGVKSNSIPSVCKVQCDVRTLPHQDEDYVRAELDQLLSGLAGVSYELDYTAEPSASPHDTGFAELVRQAACLAAGRTDLILIPAIATGFTDSRWVRRLGTVVYGFPMFDPMTDPRRLGAHCRDESIDVATLVTRTKFHTALACLTLTSSLRDEIRCRSQGGAVCP